MTMLRVMTFNLRGAGYPKDAPNLWQNRADLNLRTIRKYAPDLIGFQELQEGNLQTYNKELTEYDSFLGTPSNEPHFYNYNSIYWNPERFELVNSGGMFLSETPDVWSKSWDSMFVRSANWVRLRSKEHGRELLHFNTHLDHVGVQARVHGSRLIIQKALQLSQGELPVILTGDFNCIPWLPEYGLPQGLDFEDTGYSEFKRNGFRDIFQETGHMDTSRSHTFHGFEGDAFSVLLSGFSQRIDWILVRDGNSSMMAVASEIVLDAEPPIYPSDHYPFIGDISWSG